MLFPSLELTIQSNRISVRNLDTGRTASADAPFSCSHQFIDDVVILEHACHQLLKRGSGTAWWSFPRIRVSVPGRALHCIERKAIHDVLKNIGAHQISFDDGSLCEEQRSNQLSYVERAKRKR